MQKYFSLFTASNTSAGPDFFLNPIFMLIPQWESVLRSSMSIRLKEIPRPLYTRIKSLCWGAAGPCQDGPRGQCGTTGRKEPVGWLKCTSWEQNNYSSHLPSQCLVEAMAQRDAAGQEWSFHPAGITRSSWSCQKWQNNMLSPGKGFKHIFFFFFLFFFR